jgi:hypothetical protein
LDRAYFNPKENPSGTLDMNLSQPDGNYDYIEIHLELLSTNSKDYYFNKTIPEKCKIGYNKTIKLNSLLDKIDDLCMLSIYNVTSKTILNGFDSVEYSDQFGTGN